MIEFLCSNCGAELRVKDELAGKRGKCPRCKQYVEAPQEASREIAATTPSGKASGSAARSANPQPSSDPEATAASSVDAILGDALFESNSPTSAKDLSFLDPPQAPDELGRVGDYRILRVLGSGGMGIVLEAEDVKLRRAVAIKSLKADLAAKEEERQRFLREAQTAASIDHEHIVTIYQVGEQRGVPYLAMKLLRGESLEERLNRSGGRLPFADVVRIGQEVAEGLAAAHERGLIHRDIKPANIWLEEGRDWVRIVDFGLARVTSEETHLTQTGMIIGTPAYMAPEQANAEPLDHRCDLFSLGCLLYRMSTGQLPFKGKNTMAMLLALASKTPTAPHLLNPALPVVFSHLVAYLLEKDPNDRPASAREVCDALEAIKKAPADERETPPPPDTPSVRSPNTPPRMPKTRNTPPPVRKVEAKEIEVEELETVEEPTTRKTIAKRRAAAKRRRSLNEEELLERKVIKLAIWVGVLLFLLIVFLVARHYWIRYQDEKEKDKGKQNSVLIAADAGKPSSFRKGFSCTST